MNENQKSFLKFAAVFAIVLSVVIIFKFYGAAAIYSSGDNPSAGSSVSGSGSGNAQIVKMYVENGKYVLEPSSFKISVPVRIEADVSKMPGCSKSIVISAFNIRKTLNASDNVIEFTPDKAGTFNIVCSMNMYKGTFSVTESAGGEG